MFDIMVQRSSLPCTISIPWLLWSVRGTCKKLHSYHLPPRLVEEQGFVFAVPFGRSAHESAVITKLLSFPFFISCGHQPRFISSSTPGIKDTIASDNAISLSTVWRRYLWYSILRSQLSEHLLGANSNLLSFFCWGSSPPHNRCSLVALSPGQGHASHYLSQDTSITQGTHTCASWKCKGLRSSGRSFDQWERAVGGEMCLPLSPRWTIPRSTSVSSTCGKGHSTPLYFLLPPCFTTPSLTSAT